MLIETLNTGGTGRKEMILFLFPSIIEYNDPVFCEPTSVCFHQCFTTTKAGQRRILCGWRYFLSFSPQ